MVFEADSIRYLGFYYTNLNARKLPTVRYCVGYAAILSQIEAKCKRIGRCVVLIKKPQFLNVVSVRKTFDRHSYVVELNTSFCQMLTDISVLRQCK